MKFLIVGASGFVGRNILAYVRSLGIEALGTQSSQRESGLVKFDLLQDRICDCVKPSFFEENPPVFVVVCAVVSDMDLCLLERETSYRINVQNTIRLIEDVRGLNAKPIFLSSCFVFDGKIGYYMEEHPLSPANEYGRHKVEVENHLRACVPEALVARLDKIVGDNPYEHQLLAHWHQRILENQPIVCIRGSLLSPTYVLDVAKGIVIACQTGLSGVYHVSNSEFFYREELARQFCYALGREPNVITKPLEEFHFPDNRALNSYLDGGRFARQTGMRFTTMREVFEKFRRNIESPRQGGRV